MKPLIGPRGDVYDSKEEFLANELPREIILDKPNVIMVCAGTKIVDGVDTGEPCIVVGVRKKESEEALSAEEMIPAEVDGAITDVIEIPEFHPLGGNFAPFNTKYRPMRAGCSASISAVGGCTLGAIVKDSTDDTLVALTCNHCAGLKPDPSGAIPTDSTWYVDPAEGTNYMQPSRLDGGTDPASVCGVVKRIIPIKFNFGTNTVDVAISTLTSTAMPGVIGLTNLAPTFGSKDDYIVGDTLYKVGRTSGLTEFKVTNKNVSITFNYTPTCVATFTNIVQCDRDTYPNQDLVGGDSGSGVYAFVGGQYKLVGIAFVANTLFGGTMGFCPIETIATELDIEAWDGTGAATATPKFWVGGSGNWSDTAHWSTSSGGAGGAAVPTQIDNVTFNSSSGLSGATVTLNTEIDCKSLTCAVGAAFTVTGSQPINVYGSLTLEADMTWSCTGLLNFRGTTTGLTFTSAGKTMRSLNFAGPGGYWTLQDNLTMGDGSTLNLFGGTFDTGDNDITKASTYFNFKEEASYFSRGLVLGSSVIDLGGTTTSADQGWWFVDDAATDTSVSPYRADAINFTLDAGTSTIKCQHFEGGGEEYYDVEITGYASAYTTSITGSNTFHDLTIATTNSKGCGYQLWAYQTVENDLTIAGGSQNQQRIFINSRYLNSPNTATISVAGEVSLTNCDFTGVTFSTTVPRDANPSPGSTGYYVQDGVNGTGLLLSQSFTAQSSYSLKYVDIPMYKTGTVTDGVKCTIRTGSQLGTELGTSEEVLGSTFTGGYVTKRFTFATPVSITEDQVYYLTFYRTGARDTTNYYIARLSTGDAYTGGIMYHKFNNVWSEHGGVGGGNDLAFTVLGTSEGSQGGSSVGDGGKNAGITFTSPVTRYWVGNGGNWYDTAHWSATSGGAGGATLPLIHDTVIFNANSFSSAAQTVTIDTYAPIAKNLDLSAVTNNPTFTFTSPTFFFGSITLGTATISGSGAMGVYVFAANTLTSGASTFAMPITMYGDTNDGSITLQDAFRSTSSLTLSSGDFNANNFDVQVSSYAVSNFSAQTYMGTGTWTLTGTGTVWSGVGDIIPSTSTIKLTNASSTDKTFAGGSLVYNNIWLTGAGTGKFKFTGSNSFNDFKCDTPPHTIQFTADTTTSVQTFTVSGTAGNLMTIQSITSAPHYLQQNESIDYYSLQNYTAYYNAPQGTNFFDGFGQSFNVPSSIKLDSCGFYLYNFGTPEGNVYIDIYAHTGDFGTSSIPTGTPLAVSDPVDIATYDNTLRLREFTFSGGNRINLDANTKYIAVVRYTGGNSSEGLGIGVDFTYELHPGNLCRHNAAQGWVPTTEDLIFYIYGSAASTIERDYLSITNSHVLGDEWYAGENSTNTSGNDGWVFTAAPVESPPSSHLRRLKGNKLREYLFTNQSPLQTAPAKDKARPTKKRSEAQMGTTVAPTKTKAAPKLPPPPKQKRKTMKYRMVVSD